MRAKLGLPDGLDDDVATPLVDELLDPAAGRATSTTRRSSARLGAAARGDAEPAREPVPRPRRRSTAGWSAGAPSGPDADAMDRVNPVYIPRNHLVEEALAAATDGDLDPLERLLDAVTAPFDERPGLERYAAPAPEDFGAYRTFCGT